MWLGILNDMVWFKLHKIHGKLSPSAATFSSLLSLYYSYNSYNARRDLTVILDVKTLMLKSCTEALPSEIKCDANGS